MKRALVLSGIVVVMGRACVTQSAGAQVPPNVATSRRAVLPGTSPVASLTQQQRFERVRRGVVLVEQHGASIAIGTVLDGDGRVLTSLSGLAGAAGADLRYADGSTIHAQVGRSDQASDLALLVPQSRTWTAGLVASEGDPSGTELRAMLPSRGGPLGPALATVRGDVAAHGSEGQPTVRMLDVHVEGPTMAGAPLLDPGGQVVAVLVHACKVIPTFAPGTEAPSSPGVEPLPLPPPPCVAIVLGAPVVAIRSFLSGSVSPVAPWLGVRGESEEKASVHGVRVVAIAPSSPAEKAGLRPGDVIVAMEGKPLATSARLAELIGGHAVGDTVKLLVFGDSKFRDVSVALTGSRQAE